MRPDPSCPQAGSTLMPLRARGATEDCPVGQPVRPRSGKGGGIPDFEEQAALRQSLGRALQVLRADAGMTQAVLGLRAGVSRRSVQDLEAGRRRPSVAMLRALAVGSTRRMPPVAAVDPSPVVERLVAAAGVSLVVDTPGGVRRRERRLRDAGWVYARDTDAWWQGEVMAAQLAELAFVASVLLLEAPGALDDAAALDASQRQRAVFSEWLAQQRPGPFGTTSEFFKLARSHGYPVRRNGRAA